MTQPPPYGPAPPAKSRPSAWWFGLGIALILGAVAAAVGLFIWTLNGFLDTDATISADGETHRIRIEGDEERMLWLEDGFGQDCQIVDRATGETIPLDPVTGSFERSDGSGDWSGDSRFDPGSGDLEVTCVAGEGSVLVGPAPRIGSFVTGIVATIVVPLVLFLAGVAVLLVTGILWSLRPARAPRTR